MSDDARLRESARRPQAASTGASAEERQLVRAVLAGDRQSFRTLMDRHADVVYRICYRILHDADEANDAAQDAFLAAYRSLPTYRGEGPFRAWLARIASRRALAQRAARSPTVPLEPGPATRASEEPTPDEAAVAAERRDTLLRDVAGLPPAQREVVTLTYFGELSLSEIAAATGRPLGTVKSHLHRGLERLRAAARAHDDTAEAEG